VSWERQLDALFTDLEHQAEGLALADRDAAVAELVRAEYAEVDLASRVHASLGSSVELGVGGFGPVRGQLVAAGAGWCLLAPDARESGSRHDETVVVLAAVVSARGLAAGARPESVRPVTHRLGLGSVLRQAAETGDPVAVGRRDGTVRQGALGRVGADFVELLDDGGAVEVVPFSGIAVVRRR
jgi:hypothetical protein